MADFSNVIRSLAFENDIVVGSGLAYSDKLPSLGRVFVKLTF